MSERDVSPPQEVRWLDAVVDPKTELAPPTPLIGVLPGEGIGPEVVGAARDVLRELELAGGKAVEVETGGSIGVAAEQSTGDALPEEVAGFCRDVFARGGSILTGAGGGRYVYKTDLVSNPP